MIEGVVISSDKVLSNHLRSSVMQQLHREPLKLRCPHLLQGAPTSVPNVVPSCHHHFFNTYLSI